MAVSRKSWPNLFCTCLLLCATEAASQQFQLEPPSSTVLRGSDARFSATVEGKWEVMTWTLRRFLVLTVSVTGNVTTSSEQFSAAFCSGGDTGCVEFTIRNTTRGDSGPVICTVQGEYGSKTAQLYVQESGTVNIMGGDVTVVQDQQVELQCVTTAWFPIPTVTWTQNGKAVDSSLYNTTDMANGDSFNTTSVLKLQAVSNTTVACWATVPALTNPTSSSVFLVVERNYQDEMSRRVKTQSQISGVSVAGQRQGQVNAGYALEGQTSVTPSELTESGFGQAHDSNIFKMPDAVNSNLEGNGYNSAYNTLDESGFRKHRHVTIV
ncbi:immunoglobulin superfamily member 5 isoform X3 [Xiphias gladius]|uniref:immunoglobulin superfamily member 5 isoform X3 n=1 Tax=Xiphias gladius TaxID=8245 RepID=UPI001A990F73|nr:immunoglobulin superfamily member 5 isoform X3 [Xiphias gladius]